ncbi:uncharacterized protein LOC113552521 [Rhopalosiphum maidis]|uniref:uncharacterized protein LOC113552521 n=1 Tax=Rhopalosiphum maidis TaxID=43146 RepID=UPI000EFFCAAC|nr:uncharacterized protein LOC113552521 [Rhopalosiphum maidis]
MSSHSIPQRNYKSLCLPNLKNGKQKYIQDPIQRTAGTLSGEYRINYLGLVRCVSMPNKIVFNLYLSKNSANTTEIKGNITNYVPFDDSLNLELNMAVKDSIGGWKENAFIYKKSKGCSSLKILLGDTWSKIMEGGGAYNATCPLPLGFYNVSGVDTSIFALANFPKTFFYGR